MNNYTEELKKILKCSEKEAMSLGSTNILTTHLLLSTLKTKNNLNSILNKHNIDYITIKKELQKNKEVPYSIYSKELLSVIENTILNQTNETDEITLNNILYEILSDEKTHCYKLLNKLNINIDNLKEEITKQETIKETSILSSIGRNLNKEALNNKFDPVINRDKEINKVIEILKRKDKNNPLLIGEAGVGKTSIIEELARRITLKDVPNFLKDKTIYEISVSSLISGTKYRGEFEEKLNKIIHELETYNNVILFIDEIHTLVGAGGAEGAIDASNILKPSLARNKIKLIGATTINEYKTSIEKDKALERRFNTILINEPSKEETTYILKKIKHNYELYHNVIIKDSLLKDITYLTDKYIKNKHNPDKSIELLDEICSYTSLKEETNNNSILIDKINNLNNYLKQNNIKEAYTLKKEINKLKQKQTNNNVKVVTKSTLKNVLESITNSKILELESKTFFNNVKTKLNKIYPKETTTINEIINKIQTNNTKSITIDNTTLINDISKYLGINLITLNMKEYTSIVSINKLLGTSSGYIGYNDKNSPLEELKYKPISIILLEEYNYANAEIKALFDNIEKNKKITLNNNEIINTNNVIIIKNINKHIKRNIGFIKENENSVNNNEFTLNT